MMNIFISWESKNHPEVIEKFCEKMRKQENIIYDKYYFLGENRRVGVPVDSIAVKLDNPADHKAIYEITKGKLPEIFRQHPNENFHINVSPGTPAMHAVWLVLHAAGMLPNTTLWQTQYVEGETQLSRVRFDINTYMQEVVKLQKGVSRPVFDPSYSYKSRVLNNFLEDLRKTARLSAPLLITGERGCGKTSFIEELYAKTIRRKQIVTVACGTLTEGLAEAELFGHKKGAYTDAKIERKGYVGEADGKILFFDEVQDLSKAIQRRLVRFLESGTYRRMGEEKDHNSTAEVVFASHLPVEELRRQLDDDLFDRISMLMFNIPPLRACVADIDKFIKAIFDSLDKPSTPHIMSPVLNDEQHKEMISSGLPGNFRDIKSFLYNYIIEYSPNDNGVSAINTALCRLKQSSANTGINFEMSAEEYIKQAQHAFAQYHYEKHNQNFTKAAKSVDTSVNTMRNWFQSGEG